MENDRKGDICSPFFISSVENMLSNEQTKFIEDQLMVALAETDLFVVESHFLPDSRIEIFLDSDSGVTIKQCTLIARHINKALIEKYGEEFDYELEVGSAGLEHPLKEHRQYVKNIGRQLEVTFLDGAYLEGKLTEVGEEQFTIQYIPAKAKHKKELRSIRFDETKSVLVGVTF